MDTELLSESGDYHILLLDWSSYFCLIVGIVGILATINLIPKEL